MLTGRPDRDPGPGHSRLGETGRSLGRDAASLRGAARRRCAGRRGLREILRRLPRLRRAPAARRPARSSTERFLGLVSDQSLRTTIIAGRPDIGQPDWRSDAPGAPLTGQDVSDVVAWLAAQRPAHPGQPYAGGKTMTVSMTRRGLLLKLGLALNAVAGLALAVPIVGYLLSPARRKRMEEALTWIAISEPSPTSRRVRPEWRPSAIRRRSPGTAQTADIPCWVRRTGADAVPGLRRQLRPPRLPGPLVPAVEPVSVPVPRRRVLRRRRARRRSAAARPLPLRPPGRERPALDQGRHDADARGMPIASATGPRAPRAGCREEEIRRAPDPSDARLARRAAEARRRDPRDGGASGAAPLGELVVRLRQRRASRCSCSRSSPGICLALVYVPVGRRGVGTASRS